MKILLICSKAFYRDIPPIKAALGRLGHKVYLPNCFDDPGAESEAWQAGGREHSAFKAAMFEKSRETINKSDAVLVLNFDKEKNGAVYKNYIGGATFLEMYDAFVSGKKIYLYNGIPEGILFDEIHGFSPCVIHGDLDLIRGEDE